MLAQLWSFLHPQDSSPPFPPHSNSSAEQPAGLLRSTQFLPSVIYSSIRRATHRDSSLSLHVSLPFQLDPHFDLFTFVFLLSCMRIMFFSSSRLPIWISTFVVQRLVFLFCLFFIKTVFHRVRLASSLNARISCKLSLLPHLVSNPDGTPTEPSRFQHSLSYIPERTSHLHSSVTRSAGTSYPHLPSFLDFFFFFFMLWLLVLFGSTSPQLVLPS